MHTLPCCAVLCCALMWRRSPSVGVKMRGLGRLAPVPAARHSTALTPQHSAHAHTHLLPVIFSVRLARLSDSVLFVLVVRQRDGQPGAPVPR
jgi:hypothetical protein